MTSGKARIALAGARNAARLTNALREAAQRHEHERQENERQAAAVAIEAPAAQPVAPPPATPAAGRGWLASLIAPALRPFSRRLYATVRYFRDTSAAAQSAARLELAVAQLPERAAAASFERYLAAAAHQTSGLTAEVVSALREQTTQAQIVQAKETQAIIAAFGEFAVRLAALEADSVTLQAQLDGKVAGLKGRIEDLGRKIDQSQAAEADATSADRQIAQKLLDTSMRTAEQISGLYDGHLASFAHLRSIQSRVDLLAIQQSIPVEGGRRLALRNPEGFLVVPSDDVAQVVFLGQGSLPEPGSRTIMRRLLPVNGTLIDVGANLGVFTLWGGRIVGPGGTIIAFEPSPETAACLRQTVAVNGLQDRVELHEVAAGAAAGTASLHIGATSAWSSLLPLGGETATVTVEVRAIDDVVGSRHVDLVKIDVEGWEAHVLRGMRTLITRSPDMCIIVEYGRTHLMRSGTTPTVWLAMFSDLALEVFSIDEDTGRIVAFDTERMDATNLLIGRNIADRFPELR